MRIGLILEAELELGTTFHRRYHELVREVQVAEAAGFDFWGSSEQHSSSPVSTISAPLVLYGYVAAKTTDIRLRSQVVLLPFKMNHPIRVAEETATLDIISNGRFELGVGRGNSPYALEFFDIDARETRAQTIESLEIIGKALSEEVFEHAGERLTIPPMHLTPRPIQHPHPPMHMVATSAESHKIAGDLGVGCITFDNWLGIDQLVEPVAQYKQAIANPARPVGKAITNSLCATILPAYCAATRAEALAVGGDIVLGYVGGVADAYYDVMAKKSPDFAYMAELGKQMGAFAKAGDVEAILERTPCALLGTPDDFIERFKMFEAFGCDEVVVRIEGMGHEKVCESLEMIGRYVIPEFKYPNAIGRTAGIRQVGDGPVARVP